MKLIFVAFILSTCAAVPSRMMAPERNFVEVESTTKEATTAESCASVKTSQVGTFVSQWSNAANVNGEFTGYTPPLLTLMRYGRTSNAGYRGGLAFLKSGGKYKCWDDGFVDAEIGQVKNCDTKPGDIRNFQSDFFSYLGTVNPGNGAVTYVSDSDARWIAMGTGWLEGLPAGKTFVVRYGTHSGGTQGYIYNNFQGRFRCSDQWFGDPAIGAGKQCWYWNVPNNYLTPIDSSYMRTEKGQWVDCAVNAQMCVVATDMRPYWIRIYGFRNGNGAYTAAYRMVDTDQFQCSSAAFGYDVSSQQFSDNIGWNSFRCSWFKPDSFHFAPNGYWVNAVSGPQGAALSFTLSYGVDSSMTTVDSKEITHSITTTVEAGFIFGGSSVSYGFAQTTSHSIENAASVSVGRECAVATCAGASNWVTNVMWAWKMDVGEVCSWGDATCEATVNTCNFWCTSSLSKPPKCPPGACADLECQNCLSFR